MLCVIKNTYVCAYIDIFSLSPCVIDSARISYAIGSIMVKFI